MEINGFNLIHSYSIKKIKRAESNITIVQAVIMEIKRVGFVCIHGGKGDVVLQYHRVMALEGKDLDL